MCTALRICRSRRTSPAPRRFAPGGPVSVDFIIVFGDRQDGAFQIVDDGDVLHYHVPARLGTNAVMLDFDVQRD